MLDAQDKPKDESSSDHDDNEPTPTDAPSQPTVIAATGTHATSSQHPMRPTLARSPPPTNFAAARQTQDEPTDSDSSVSSSYGTSDEQSSSALPLRHSATSSSRGKGTPAAAQQGDLAQLKDALNAKLVAQSRPRKSYDSSARQGVKRVPPIKEEGSTSERFPLNAVLGAPDEPVRTSSTASTESTESNRTIRGSAAPTPAAQALRTPSYPFPYVPGTPRWAYPGHRPFTALSPTTSAEPRDDQQTPGKTSTEVFSGRSTPAANSVFMPPGVDLYGPEDSRYPAPNLYDLVLQLTAEPGLDQWWETVTDILHQHFKAERATLAQPLDPTDIENVPWGVRATFSKNGREEFVSHGTVMEQTFRASQSNSLQRPDLVIREPSSEAPSPDGPQKLHTERLRPRLESRHSYAGHGREVKDVLGTLNEPGMRAKARPLGPQRTMTHAPGAAGGVSPARLPPKRLSSASSARQGSLSDPEFSSIGGNLDVGPYAEIFDTLRALNFEARPLIEPGGVNRVLERGRVVTVTRDYVSEPPYKDLSQSAPGLAAEKKPGKTLSNYRSAFASDNGRDYEEYEQQPASPWAQSPAPSPAIQSDEEANPFFATDDSQVDDSFNPAISPKDYSQVGQVEAIGVDHASTVIHIPLMHPSLSQPMQSLRMTPRAKDRPEKLQRSNTVDLERRSPIAILSVLTSTVPYPHNLTQSLKLLGPHLATSFAIAQQFSAAVDRAAGTKRTAGLAISNVAWPLEPASLDDIVNADLEQPPGSMSGSVTSPSDYSGRSGASPSGSIVGTPGWDPAAHGWTASRSVASTPAWSGTEMVDNYFEAKKRTSHRSSNASATVTPARNAKKAPPSDGKSGPSDDGLSRSGSQGERQLKLAASGNKDDKSAVPPSGRERSPSRSGEGASPGGLRRPRPSISASAELKESKQHSLLHSYGADFHSTFGVSPAMTPGDARTPAGAVHLRKGSYPEDMPPPSERLLRTIIDSVPVQIFTAQPDSGQMSWVNSKFLIYRGQEPRQVLSDPWGTIHPEDRSEFMSAWQRSLRTNQQLQQKIRLQRFDGSYRWFYVRAAPLKDKRQKVVHWIGTMMDFHEQQLAEMNSARQQETEASEAKYRALANSSPQVVFAVNRSKGVTFCNTQWLHFSGQTEAQALGVGFMDHVHPDDLVKCRLPTFDKGSNVPKNVPTSLPFEPKRTASQTASQSAASSSGSSETEKAQSSPSDVSFSLEPHRPPQRKLSELASTGILKVSQDADGRPSYSTEVRLKSKEGDYRWHLVRVLLADPLLNHDEEETWYGTCTDINDHKTLERDLKETMDEKSRFLSNMSHEIRTPLNGITGMVNFLIDSSLTAEQMEHVSIIRASTEGLRGLINDILDLSKAEAGMIQLNMDWLYVRALIEEVNDLTSAMAIDKGLELNYIVEEDVPPQVKGDRFRLRQILLNIVGNAIKFTQSGEVFIKCSLQNSEGELAKNEAYIKFEIVDTGRGFTEKEAEFLFKRFSQIDGSSTRQHGGTGLGLVISKQLTQLHGGDMSAVGVPEKGSTFAFYIKTTIPSRTDQPPLPTPATGSMPEAPHSSAPVPTPTATPSIPAVAESYQAKAAHKILQETTMQSPSPHLTSPEGGRNSPSVSSAGSNPSIHSLGRTNSAHSERSSVSSIVPEPSGDNTAMHLSLPKDRSPSTSDTSPDSTASAQTTRAAITSLSKSLAPPVFSILVVAPLKYSREATVHHIDKTLPKNVPHQITARESTQQCQELLGGSEPVIFSHIVVVLQDVDQIVALMDQVFGSTTSTTSIVLITDLAQRRKIVEQAPNYNYDQLVSNRRLQFVFKPLKPSRFGLIFDPQKEREMSLDRNQDSAQQVAMNQKQVFEELTRRLGNKDKRVLLVEDNRVNQMVILKFLAKVSIKVETVQDGVQCTDKVFAQPHGHYSIILCDLHMPNKDGYQTCKEIRKWEKKNKYPHLPIIALSANVLGDVWQKCVEAGFNSYLTKPVDFKELSTVLMNFMDCEPNKTHEFMKLKRGHAPGILSSMGR